MPNSHENCPIAAFPEEFQELIAEYAGCLSVFFIDLIDGDANEAIEKEARRRKPEIRKILEASGLEGWESAADLCVMRKYNKQPLNSPHYCPESEIA